MTKEEHESLKIWFKDYIDRFRDGNGILHSMLELKQNHSIRVAENARLIAASLNMPDSLQCLAEGIGLIHDVGRFTQFTDYGSFSDAVTVDHGAEGRRVLEAENLPFPCKPEDRELLLCSVEYHNKKVLDIPRGFSSGQEQILQLIRDADKLDIMNFILNSIASDGFRNLPTMLPHISLCREISPEVLKEARDTRSVSISNLRTTGDLLIMAATWFYDLNYQSTLHMAMQKNILLRIQRELPEAEAAGDVFGRIINTLFEEEADVCAEIQRGKMPDMPDKRLFS